MQDQEQVRQRKMGSPAGNQAPSIRIGKGDACGHVEGYALKIDRVGPAQGQRSGNSGTPGWSCYNASGALAFNCNEASKLVRGRVETSVLAALWMSKMDVAQVPVPGAPPRCVNGRNIHARLLPEWG